MACILLTICVANHVVATSESCPTCGYWDKRITGTQQPGKDCICLKLVFDPTVRVCSIPNTSDYECFNNSAPTLVSVSSYLATSPDCSGCETADYTFMGTRANAPIYECYTDDTYCGGNGRR